jgi:hypothetical protein
MSDERVTMRRLKTSARPGRLVQPEGYVGEFSPDDAAALIEAQAACTVDHGGADLNAGNPAGVAALEQAMATLNAARAERGLPPVKVAEPDAKQQVAKLHEDVRHQQLEQAGQRRAAADRATAAEQKSHQAAQDDQGRADRDAAVGEAGLRAAEADKRAGATAAQEAAAEALANPPEPAELPEADAEETGDGQAEEAEQPEGGEVAEEPAAETTTTEAAEAAVQPTAPARRRRRTTGKHPSGE